MSHHLDTFTRPCRALLIAVCVQVSYGYAYDTIALMDRFWHGEISEQEFLTLGQPILAKYPRDANRKRERRIFR